MRRLSVLCATGLAVWWTPDARACSPWHPHLEHSAPPAGGVLPAGADLLLHGQVLLPDNLSATVEGVPVDLSLVVERSVGVWYFGWDHAWRTMALRIDPPPVAGQTVVVTGDPCFREEHYIHCDDIELVFTVGEADTSAPDAPLELWYDVYDNGTTADEYDSCGGAGNLQYEMTVRIELDQVVAEYPLAYQLSRRPRQTPDAWLLVENDWLFHYDERHSRSFRWRYRPDGVEGWLPLAEAFCLRLETFDASGNLGGSIEVCPPCRDQIGSEPAPLFGWPVSSPNYSNEWRYPDGYCPAGLEPDEPDEPDEPEELDAPNDTDDDEEAHEPTADESTVVPRGCSCASETPRSPSQELGVLLPLVVLSARRRRG